MTIDHSILNSVRSATGDKAETTPAGAPAPAPEPVTLGRTHRSGSVTFSGSAFDLGLARLVTADADD